ncbi:MAG: FG-GAP-like repeat-containing protein [Bacteroidota bacterium]
MRYTAYIAVLFCVLCIPAPLLAQNFQLSTQTAGLDINDAQDHNGVAVADYDMDGDLDIYMVAYFQYDPDRPKTWNRLYQNDGNGQFTDVTAEAGVLSKVNGFARGGMGNKFGASWADYDNDGDPDLFLTNVGPEILFKNEGNGTFTDVTEAAGLSHSDGSATSSSVWWDLDLDGDLDLYVSVWADSDSPNRLYENLGDGTFKDISLGSGLQDGGLTWTSIPIDANNDGLPDLYVVNDFGPNKFYVNNGDKSFTEATAAYGLEDEGHGMGVTVGDYNNDGFFDIYLTNIEEYYLNPLFVNTGNGSFENQAVERGVSGAGWAWGTEFFDCDHDGDLDLYVANGFLIEPFSNVFFTNQLVGTNLLEYTNVSEKSGANGEAEARGLVVFDSDNDGDLDLLVANWRETPYLYTNESPSLNWLKVDLEGTVSNRDAFGATLTVHANGQTYHRYHDGVDFLGQSVQPVHFGVSYANMIDELVIRWPNGTEETLYNIPTNQTIKVVEGHGLSATSTEDGGQLPGEDFTLFRAYPNPFSENTHVSFNLPHAGDVDLAVYNILGQEVYSTKTSLTAGKHDLPLRSAAFATSGMYIYRLIWENKVYSGVLSRIK